MKASSFEQFGFTGPLPIWSAKECSQFLQAVHDIYNRHPLDWPKGYAASSRAFYEASTDPRLLDVVKHILGHDIIIWGASLVHREPNQIHPWHSDVESTAVTHPTVSVWIGLENISEKSALQLISYSHQFHTSVQEIRQQHNVKRDAANSQNILKWAQKLNPRSELIIPKMKTGDALFFHGHTWHHSENTTKLPRTALLLQYATPEAPIRIPDYRYLDYPFVQKEWPRPACVLLSGGDEAQVNRIVPAPAAHTEWSLEQLTSRNYPIELPLPIPPKTIWQPHHIFRGRTTDIEVLAGHISTLAPNQCPHPPHKHADEEILICLTGEVDVILPKASEKDGGARQRLRRGDGVYYPAHFPHTLETQGAHHANYIMFKWDNPRFPTRTPLRFQRFNICGMPGENIQENQGFKYGLKFEGPTDTLRKLHCHVSQLEPGGGYEPHIDAYDVVLIILEGFVETRGEILGPHSLAFYAAGEPHGIRNSGTVSAHYAVIEFHGSQTAQSTAFPDKKPETITSKDPARREFLKKLITPRCYIRKIKKLWTEHRW